MAIPYSDIGNINENTLMLYTFNETTGNWEEVPNCWVDTTHNIIYGTLTLTHFTLIAPLVSITFAPTNNDAYCYPNPWEKNDPKQGGSYIYFANVSQGSTIKIYNIAGEEIDKINVTECPQKWDISNKNIASGIYIYLITNDQNQKATGKIGIIK